MAVPIPADATGQPGRTPIPPDATGPPEASQAQTPRYLIPPDATATPDIRDLALLHMVGQEHGEDIPQPGSPLRGEGTPAHVLHAAIVAAANEDQAKEMVPISPLIPKKLALSGLSPGLKPASLQPSLRYNANTKTFEEIPSDIAQLESGSADRDRSWQLDRAEGSLGTAPYVLGVGQAVGQMVTDPTNLLLLGTGLVAPRAIKALAEAKALSAGAAAAGAAMTAPPVLKAAFGLQMLKGAREAIPQVTQSIGNAVATKNWTQAKIDISKFLTGAAVGTAGLVGGVGEMRGPTADAAIAARKALATRARIGPEGAPLPKPPSDWATLETPPAGPLNEWPTPAEELPITPSPEQPLSTLRMRGRKTPAEVADLTLSPNPEQALQYLELTPEGVAYKGAASRLSGAFMAYDPKRDGPLPEFIDRHVAQEAEYMRLEALDRVATEQGILKPGELAQIMLDHEPARDGPRAEYIADEIQRLAGGEASVVPPSGMSDTVVQAPNKDVVQKLAPADPESIAQLDALWGKPRTQEDFQAVVDHTLKPGYGLDVPIKVLLDEKFTVAQNRKVGEGWEIGLPENARADELAHEIMEIRQKVGQVSGIPHDQNEIVADHLEKAAAPAVEPLPDPRTIPKQNLGPLSREMLDAEAFTPATVGEGVKTLFRNAVGAPERSGRAFGAQVLDALYPEHHVASDIRNVINVGRGFINEQLERFSAYAIQHHFLESFRDAGREDPNLLTRTVAYLKGTLDPAEEAELETRLPEAKAFREWWRPLDDALYQKQIKYAPTDYQKDHFRVFFKVSPTSGALIDQLYDKLYGGTVGGKAGTTTWSRQAIWQDIPAALQAATETEAGQAMIEKLGRPLEARDILKSDNPVVNAILDLSGRAKFVGYGMMLDGLKTEGARVRVLDALLAPDGWVAQRTIPGAHNLPIEAVEDPGEYFLEPGAGRLLKNYLSRDPFADSKFGQLLTYYAGLQKAWALAVPIFHAGNIAQLAWASQLRNAMGEAIRGIARADPAKMVDAAMAWAKVPGAPINMAIEGGKIKKYFTDPEAFKADQANAEFLAAHPQLDHAIDLLFDAGGQVGVNETYRLGWGETIRDAWTLDRDEHAGVRILTGVAPQAVRAISLGLFSDWIPQIKLSVFARDMAVELAKNADRIDRGDVSETTIARTVHNSLDDRFGMMPMDATYWNKTVARTLQALVLAPTWQRGNLAFLTRGLGGQTQNIAQWLGPLLKGEGLGPRPALDYNFSNLLSMMVVHAAISQTFQALADGSGLLAGKPTDTWGRDLFAPRSGGVDQYGKPNRLLLPGYVRSYSSMVAGGPLKYAMNITSPWLHGVIDGVRNADYNGVQVWDPADPWPMSMLKGLEHSLALPSNFYASAVRRSQEQEGGAAKYMTWGGWQLAPKHLDETDGEAAIRRNFISHHSWLTGAAQEGRLNLDSLQKYRAQIAAGADAQALEETAAGLSPNQIKSAHQARNLNLYDKWFAASSVPDQLDQWDHLSPAEKVRMGPYLAKKAQGSWPNSVAKSDLPLMEDKIKRALAEFETLQRQSAQ